MALENDLFDDLLKDVDEHVDEEVEEGEVVDNDPLGLADFNKSSDDTEDNEEPAKDETPEVEEKETTSDFISAYLKGYGIDDPTKIQMENENGEVEEVDFNSLSDDEKLSIFKELADPGYTDYEKQVVEYLRRNNTTFEDVISYYQNKAIEDYLNEHPEDRHQRAYSIDEYTDDEVYLADLKNKYPDFTDEELTAKLDSAKLNDELFNKEVAAIRTNLKNIEEQELQQQQEAEAQSYQELQNSLQNAMADFTEIALDPDDPKTEVLQIEDSDKQVMLRYLTELGKDGKSQLVRDLEDPNALIELAYYRTRERDNLTGLTRYWKNELANERKEKAKLQKELDKYKNKEEKSFVATPKNSTKKPSNKRTMLDIY